jgi:inhibitor of cysteine peptidase
VDLACGSILEISLKGNPTTGYSWEAEALDPKMLKQIGEPEFIPDSQLYGSGGTIILKFLATGSGLTHLKVIYHRSFEKNVAPLAMFATDILIK